MNLYLDAGILSAFVVLLVCPFSTWLARASWVTRSPRAAVALWHSHWPQRHAGDDRGGPLRRHRALSRRLRGRRGRTGGGDCRWTSSPGTRPARRTRSDVGGRRRRRARQRGRSRHLAHRPGPSAPPPPAQSAGRSVSRAATGTLTLDHPSPVAYCLPGIRPRIVISSGTMRLLDQAQLAAVIEHERGHAHERHGLVMLPMTSLTEPFRWIPYARLAPRAVAGLLEMAADDHAARRHAPSSLASALVALSTSGAPPPLCLRPRLTRCQRSGAPAPWWRPAIQDGVRRGGTALRSVCCHPLGPSPVFLTNPDALGPDQASTRPARPEPDLGHAFRRSTNPTRGGRSGDGEHPFQRHLGPFGRVGVDGDAVAHLALDQALEDPGQVLGVDARHGRAGAHERIEADHRLVG